ncbi:T9SS type A sorting domain-containing protein [bacterium]|nr:T9SS type A sorting domain-containing protein [bacterium]
MAFGQTPAPFGLQADVDRATGATTLNWYEYDQEFLGYHDGSLETAWTSLAAPGNAWAVHMMVDNEVTLDAVSVYTHAAMGNSGWVPMEDVQLMVLDSSGGSEPGAVLYTSDPLSGDPDGWVTVDVSAENFTFTDDFWVAVVFTASGAPFIGCDSTNPVTGVQYQAMPPYTAWAEMLGFGCNLAIQALVSSNDQVSLLAPESGANTDPVQAVENVMQWDAPEGMSAPMGIPAAWDSQSNELDEFITYKVYRDGNEIAQTTDDTYTDYLSAEGTYQYEVTALHDNDESDPTVADAYWTGNIAPAINPAVVVNQGTGEATVSWEAPEWGNPAVVMGEFEEPAASQWYWQGGTFCMKFTPTELCRLIAVRMHLVGAAEFGVRLFDVENGWPNDMILDMVHGEHEPGWVEINLEDQFLFFDEPFVAGFLDMNSMNRITYNDAVGANSFLLNPSGNWGNFNGGELALFIEAVVEYPNGTQATLGGGNEIDDLAGFEIFRDGSLAGQVGPNAREFTDALPASGDYEYTIVAHYDEGVAPASEPAVGSWEQPDQIADVQTDPDSYLGTEVTFVAVVTQGHNTVHTQYVDVYIQDNSGYGIAVYSWDPAQGVGLDRGDLIEITGTIDQYFDTTELINFTFTELSSGNPLPEPMVFATGDIDDSVPYEGVWAEITGTLQWDPSEPGTSFNIWVDDGSGPADVRVWGDANLDFSGFLGGDEITLRGTIDSYNGIGQLQPSAQEDIEAPQNNDPAVLTLTPVQATVPPNGGNVVYNLHLQSFLPGSYPNLYYKVYAHLPNGTLYGPVSTQTFTMTPFMNVTLYNQTLSVPAMAPAGVYTFEGRVGMNANLYIADTFEFTKSAGGVESGDMVDVWAASEVAFNGAAAATVELPVKYEMGQAWPNPFNPTCAVDVSLPEASELTVSVFNVMGQRVATLASGITPAGAHSFSFDGSQLSSGIYFIRAEVPGKLNGLRKVTLMK